MSNPDIFVTVHQKITSG